MTPSEIEQVLESQEKTIRYMTDMLFALSSIIVGMIGIERWEQEWAASKEFLDEKIKEKKTVINILSQLESK